MVTTLSHCYFRIVLLITPSSTPQKGSGLLGQVQKRGLLNLVKCTLNFQGFQTVRTCTLVAIALYLESIRKQSTWGMRTPVIQSQLLAVWF